MQSTFESDNLTDPKEDSWHCQPDIALPLISVKLSDSSGSEKKKARGLGGGGGLL